MVAVVVEPNSPRQGYSGRQECRPPPINPQFKRAEVSQSRPPPPMQLGSWQRPGENLQRPYRCQLLGVEPRDRA